LLFVDREGGREGGRGGEGGRGRGGGRGGPKRGGPKKDDDISSWVPVTKLGRLVKARLIKSLEAVYLFSLPVKEYQIVETFLPELKDEVAKIMPIQKQTRAGQRTRFKAFVVVGDQNGHIGLGVKCAKEVANAIRGAIIAAKIAVVPVRRGYWGNRIGAVHTVPTKVTAKCGSISVRLIPAPRGTGLVAARAPKKLLQLAGVQDCFTSACGKTATMGNFIKATYAALGLTYKYLTPDLWKKQSIPRHPFSEYSAFFETQKAKPVAAKAGKAQ
jgi:small subunit ribosomal protein S2e